jgi:hypothetical protein
MSRDHRHRSTVIARRRAARLVTAARQPMRPPGAVLVAVPARDEAEHIIACLRTIDDAAASCDVPVHVVVAADRCGDGTGELAASFVPTHCRVSVIEGRWRSVSGARAAAVATGRAEAGGADVWIANTDADCRVPADWLAVQLGVAAQGVAAVAGTVRLAEDAPIDVAARFRRMYVAKAGQGHVHAANLGIHAEAYEAVGGWSPSTSLGEEHHLWRRLRRHRFHAAHEAGLWVYTSHRTHGRATGGFASVLRRLAETA